MLKIKSLNITFESLDSFATRTKILIQDVIKTRKPAIQKKDVLIWESVEAYQQFMSDQKYAILAAISKYDPASVYQLAKILNRAQQNVARDCDLLEQHGFIKFKDSTIGRKSKMPKLSFDYNVIVVCLPSVTYKVALSEAA